METQSISRDVSEKVQLEEQQGALPRDGAAPDVIGWVIPWDEGRWASLSSSP